MSRALKSLGVSILLAATACLVSVEAARADAGQACVSVDSYDFSTDRNQVVANCTQALDDAKSDPALQAKYYLARAWAEFHLSHNDKASADADAALARAPKSIEALLIKGLVEEDRLNNDAALKNLDAVLAVDPGNLKALMARSRLRVSHLNDPKGAQADVDQALKVAPSSPITLRGQAELVGRTSKKDAEVILRKALQIAPNDLRTLVDLADCLRDLERNDEAGKLFDQAVAAYPRTGYAYRARAWHRVLTADLKAATSDVEMALGLNPDSGSAYLIRGVILTRQDRLDQAIIAYNRALALDPAYPYAFQNLSDIYRQKKDFAAALKAADDGLKLAPKDTNLLFSRAFALHATGDFLAERKTYDTLIDHSPDAVAYYNRGLLWSKEGDHKLALKDYEAAEKLDPKDLDTLYNKGVELESLDRWKEAIKTYEGIAVLDPTSSKPWIFKGNVYLDNNDPDSAMASFQQAIKLNPKSGEAHRRLAEAYVDKDQEDAARSEFALALKLDSKDEWAWLDLGVLNMVADRTKEARSNFDRVLQINPKNAEALARRAVLKWWDGKDEPALVDLGAALEIEPDYTYALNYRGLVYRDMEKLDEALADYDRVIEINPEFEAAYYNRADVYIGKDRYDRAIRDLNMALKLAPNDALDLRRRGFVFYLMRDYLRALEDLDAAILADPKDSVAYERRADVKTELGDTEGAKADLASSKALAK